MNRKPIIIVAGEPNSVFLEIFFKTFKLKVFKSPLILIASHKLLKLQMKSLKFKKNIRRLDKKKLNEYKLDNKSINLININYNTTKAFNLISSNSNQYIENCFSSAIELIKSGYSSSLINGPIAKNHFLNKKFLGITEYLANKFKTKKIAMLIYNKKLSVCPITTHLPLKLVSKKITKRLIIEKVKLVKNFYKRTIGFDPKIAVVGLNPHCESVDNFSEDLKIITPAIKNLSRANYKVFGPFPADTIFLKNNRKKYDVIIGMYHDQVLTPIKTLFEYDAINITLGLPFIRISPDHGPNEKMIGKNLSNPLSLFQAINFLENQNAKS